MAVGGAIGTRSVLIGVCKRRRQIGEAVLWGRVSENVRIVVFCNLNNVRIHGLFIGAGTDYVLATECSKWVGAAVVAVVCR